MNNSDFLPFSRPTISEDAIDEVIACLRSGWITTGPRVAAFAKALEKYLECENIVLVSSATAGLHLALLAMGIGQGDEVITTPLTFAATLNTIEVVGARPVLVDIDPVTLNIDLDKLEDVITSKTKLLLPVHFAGLPLDLTKLYQFAENYNLRVLEDASHAIGAKYLEKKLGSFGDTQVFSFHPNKNMTTGEGGCVVTRDIKLAKKIKQLSFHGIDRNATNRFSKGGSQNYDVVAAGYKYNMMDMQASLGLHQLKRLDEFIVKRNQLVKKYYESLINWKQFTLPKLPNYKYKHAWHLFTPLINQDEAGMDRDSFMQYMQEKNIGTGLHYNAIHLYSYYQKKYGFKIGDFPFAENVAERIVSLPLFPSMTSEDQDRVINAMAEIFARL